MKKICAWHQQYFPTQSNLMGEVEPFEDTTETHGICRSCMDITLQKAGVKINKKEVKMFFKCFP